MALNLQQVQKQSQRLIMTPQMQQSIQLLQLNAIELEQLAEQELLENPFLQIEEEQAEPEERSDSELRDKSDNQGEKDDDEPAAPELFDYGDHASPADSNGTAESLNGSAESLSDTAQTQQSETAADGAAGPDQDGTAGDPDDSGPDTPEIEQAPEQFEEVDVNWDDYYSDAENSTYTSTYEHDTEERDFSEYVAARSSLLDHLMWQLRCSVLEGTMARIGEHLIGSLDEDGYLDPAAIDEAAVEFGVPVEDVEFVLSVIHDFEPAGVGARSLAECLLVQMKQLGGYSEFAKQVLEQHMDLFQRKRFREIARKMDVEEERVQALFARVSRLEPYPGRSMTRESVQYIQPDVYVKLIDGELMIYLNEGQSGRLSVNRFYQRMVRQQRQALTKQDKEYAAEKYRSALALIKNIEKRKSTILRVTEAIMEVQRPFLEKGIEALKPLTLREVADMVGMHESTVARVTSRKYVETPQGTYLLKYFFSSSIESEGHEAVSSRTIKDKLRQIIEAEDPKKPISDQKIAEELKRQGYAIARRTVAKYREQLKILPAKYRRQS